eukprot:COSAG04_NODE_13_length_42806_cov_92.030323_19_plen_178_part_00
MRCGARSGRGRGSPPSRPSPSPRSSRAPTRRSARPWAGCSRAWATKLTSARCASTRRCLARGASSIAARLWSARAAWHRSGAARSARRASGQGDSAPRRSRRRRRRRCRAPKTIMCTAQSGGAQARATARPSRTWSFAATRPFPSHSAVRVVLICELSVSLTPKVSLFQTVRPSTGS